jgi:hypothetical protein
VRAAGKQLGGAVIGGDCGVGTIHPSRADICGGLSGA